MTAYELQSRSLADEFNNALAAGQLVIQRCNVCGKVNMYPRYRCPACQSGDLGWQQSAGTGVLVTHAVVRAVPPKGFESDLPYEFLTGRVRPWNYHPYENRYVNVAETLRRAMTQNPFLRVFVGKGYYDLATPFFAAEYTFDHLGLDPTLRSHLSGGYYEAGHMMYVHPASLVKLKQDLAQFIQASTAK